MCAGPVRAQSTLTPDEYNALVTAVESTPSQPASEAPLIGNFYTITHGESWPPLPSDTPGLNFWSLGGNYYLLDDREYGYSAIRTDSSFEPPPSLTNVGSGGSGGNPYFTPPVYTTNDLWLQITTNLVGSNATLIIHPPSTVTQGVYDVLTATNLTQPIDWQWLLRTDPGQTNLTISIGTNAGTFYRLGTTGTWLTFPTLDTNTGGNLSVYITSAAGATGTLTLEDQSNGPTVTIMGDPSVAGTYMLTNTEVIPDFYFYPFLEQNLFDNAFVTNVYAKGSLVIFYDNNPDDGPGWFLCDSSNYIVLDTGAPAMDLNDVAWDDGNDQPTNLTATCAEFSMVQPFSLSAGMATNIVLPGTAMVGQYQVGIVQSSTGIYVEADNPVSVYAVEYSQELTSAFTACPANLLGTNYLLMARASLLPPSGSHGGTSELAIVATVDKTTVRITPSSNANLSSGGGTNIITLMLHEGQAYEIQSAGESADVTGTQVTSDKPIAVFAGVSDAYVPDAITQADNPLMQEQIPVEGWGTNALSLSFAGRTNGDSYRILAAQDGTTVMIMGNILTSTNEASPPWTVTTSNETLTVIITNAGQFVDMSAEGPVQFQSDKPIQVAHFGNGTFFDNSNTGESDPCEILMVPIDRYLETNVIVSLTNDGVRGDFDENYLTVIVPQAATNATSVDSKPVPVASFSEIGTSSYYGARVVLTNSGPHVVISSQPAYVEAYGWGAQDAYGYAGSLVK